MTKPGYQITIRSWENDADHYQTKVLEGLTRADTAFYVEVVSLFRSKRNRPIVGFGNGSLDMEYFADMLAEIRERHPDISDTLKADLDDCKAEEKYADDRHYEFLTDLIGNPVDYDSSDWPHFCRVVESYKIIYVPEALDDVTSQFGPGTLR